MKSLRFHLPAKVIALACIALAGTAAFAASASATTVPVHSYSLSCPKLGYYGNRITVIPIRIEKQAGVGLSVIDGTGNHYATTRQYTYFKLWAYSTRNGTWYQSPFKRVLDGFPNLTVEVYDTAHGWWSSVGGGIDNPDLAVGPNAVSITPFTGSGTWYIFVETYWAPPEVNLTASDLTSPNPASGGLDVADAYNGTCTF